MTTTVGVERPAVEVADIIREYGAAFLAKYGGWLSVTQKKALRDLGRCRTAALGGHVERCRDCGHQRLAYNSCRNRHCPKCQALSRARWLAREAELLLPVEYHHVVFTLPQEVAELALANPALMYDLLFRAAAATLRQVAANPKHLGAQIGVLLVLHTWGQNLHHHPHVHGVCTGGGLSCDEHGHIDAAPKWRSCRPGFFLPVRVLSRLFRGKYLAMLRQAFDNGKLLFPGRLAPLASAAAFACWLSPLYAQDWVVYAKPPFGGPEQVLKYLARYTHRVAISNHRLVALDDGRVTFRYKDYADAQPQKTMTLSAEEFLRRFVQHVLPAGFVKTRHYGLLANRVREDKLEVCRRLLLVALVEAKLDSTAQQVDVVPRRCCPNCGGTKLIIVDLPKAVASIVVDTS
jgi:Putative transposase/Transposase zinc-binding domain